MTHNTPVVPSPAPDADALRGRVDALGAAHLDRRERHELFADLYAAFTPSGFRLMPWPDRTAVRPNGHEIDIEAVLVDENINGQVVGEIARHVRLEEGFVSHELLRIQGPYRRQGLSLVLLNQALPFYRAVGLNAVVVHAALETGRWHWARLGFDFAPDSRWSMEGWCALCCVALGRPPLASGFPPSELALLGSGPDAESTTMAQLRVALVGLVDELEADEAASRTIARLIDFCETRARVESSGRWGWRDAERFAMLATANGHGPDKLMPIGKAIMLAGPDWYGIFDLHDPVAQQVFEAEFERRFSTP